MENDKMTGKIEIITLSERLTFHFIHVPEGFKMKDFTLSDHTVYRLTRLNTLNKSKKVAGLKKSLKTPDLQVFFTNILKVSRGWNFEEFPNPQVVACVYQGK